MSEIDLAYLPVVGRGLQIKIICAMHKIKVNYLLSKPMGDDFDKDKDIPLECIILDAKYYDIQEKSMPQPLARRRAEAWWRINLSCLRQMFRCGPLRRGYKRGCASGKCDLVD